MIYRYLDCGDFHNGFARVKCKDCGHEYWLAFSCKRRHFCPSCRQKRAVEFGGWLCADIRVALPLELKKLEAIFQHKTLKMLLNRGKIAKEMIAMLATWRHSSFHVFCGNRTSPTDETAMENLARYIIQASFSQERMQYLDQVGTETKRRSGKVGPG